MILEAALAKIREFTQKAVEIRRNQMARLESADAKSREMSARDGKRKVRRSGRGDSEPAVINDLLRGLDGNN